MSADRASARSRSEGARARGRESSPLHEMHPNRSFSDLATKPHAMPPSAAASRNSRSLAPSLLRSFAILLGVLVATCTLSGCPDRGTPAAAAFAQRYGQSPAVSATVLVRIEPVDPAAGDPQQFTAYLSCAANGDVRAKLTRAEVTAVEALIRDDGSFTAWSPRSQAATEGAADQAPAVLSHLRWLRDELRLGPVPPGVEAGHDTSRLHWEIAGRQETLIIGTEIGAAGKSVTTDDGAYRLSYSREQLYDHLRRASRIEISTHDARLLVVIRSLAAIGDIDPGKMKLEIPVDAPRVSVEEFVQGLR